MSYICPVCKLEFADQETADACQSWCSTHNSCNFKIARQAINKDAARAMSPEEDSRFH